MRKVKLSFKDQLRQNDAAMRAWGAAFGKPVEPHMLSGVEEKKVRAKPVKRAESSEHREQCKVIAWWAKWCHKFEAPAFALFAIPNGGARDVITGARLKAEGVRSGVYDLFLAVPHGSRHGLFIEMKYGKNKTSEAQDEFGDFVEGQGYDTVVCWTGEDAIWEIKLYFGVPSSERPDCV